jgi:uncharacterized protein (TIGR02147 family)
VLILSIFEYTDYRKFLLDFYKNKKSLNRNFSHRYIGLHVGFKSGGHFAQILSGKANISISYIERLSDFLGLNKNEAQYFLNVVLYNQAKNHDDKKRYFKKMISFKDSAVHTVDAEHFEFYDKWYYTAIREILSFYPFKQNYDRLANMLMPTITIAQARHAIDLLNRLGLIVYDASGNYIPSSSLISTGYEAQSLCINNFVVHSLDLAKSAIDRFDRHERNLSWVSLSLSQESYATVIEELRDFRRRMMNIAIHDENPDRAYLINIQVFPCSKQYKINRGGNE